MCWLFTTCPLLSDWTLLSLSYFPPTVLIAVNGERLVYPVLPPISWTSAPLPLQPLLQGWEQPHWTVSHQFCACRLLRSSSAAPAHCTACRSTSTFTFPGASYRQCSGRRHFRVCHFVFSFLPLSCVVPLFHFFTPFCFCPSVSSFHSLFSGVATLEYLINVTDNQTIFSLFCWDGSICTNSGKADTMLCLMWHPITLVFSCDGL